MYYVFVYGSLKKGFINSHLLKGQRFLGTFHTKDNCYYMEKIGAYPAVTKTGQDIIEGEIYEIQDHCFTELDTLKANGIVYKRELTQINHFAYPCWMYLLVNPNASYSTIKQKCHIKFSQINTSSRIASWKRDTLFTQFYRVTTFLLQLVYEATISWPFSG